MYLSSKKRDAEETALNLFKIKNAYVPYPGFSQYALPAHPPYAYTQSLTGTDCVTLTKPAFGCDRATRMISLLLRHAGSSMTVIKKASNMTLIAV
jgi:hypothetical protein